MVQDAIALGHGVGGVPEGCEHGVERRVQQRAHVIRRHALGVDLRQDLQSDGACGGTNNNCIVEKWRPILPLTLDLLRKAKKDGKHWLEGSHQN